MSMEELGIGAAVPVVMGEIEAGRGAKVRREINKLIKAVSTNSFDLMDLLYEVKSNHYYSPDFESFSKYAKSLEIKYSKAYYLVQIKSLMVGVNLDRPLYEPLGIYKLRTIAKLKLEGEYNGIPMPQVIKELVEKAASMSDEEVKLAVDEILGLTKDESMVWLNIQLKKSARDNVIKPALELAKKHMPESQTQDAEGNYIDPSDGAALEMICANFLADVNFNPPIEQESVGEASIEQEIAALEQQLKEQNGEPETGGEDNSSQSA